MSKFLLLFGRFFLSLEWYIAKTGYVIHGVYIFLIEKSTISGVLRKSRDN